MTLTKQTSCALSETERACAGFGCKAAWSQRVLTGVHVATIEEIKYEDCLLLLYILFFFYS